MNPLHWKWVEDVIRPMLRDELDATGKQPVEFWLGSGELPPQWSCELLIHPRENRAAFYFGKVLGVEIWSYSCPWSEDTLRARLWEMGAMSETMQRELDQR